MALKTCIRPAGSVGAYAKVEIRLSQDTIVTAGGANYLALPIEITAAADGSYSVQLQANNDLTPNGTYYSVSEYGGVTDQTLYIQVPTSAGPFVITNILVSPLPTVAASPNHVSTLIVDGTATFTAGPITMPAASLPESVIINLTADLAAKATDSLTVHLAGIETIASVKSFSAAPAFNAGFTIPNGQAGTFGSGDNVQARQNWPATVGQFLHLVKGTAASPDTTSAPLVKLSRTVDQNTGTETGDGNYGGAALEAEIVGTVDHVIPITGLIGNAKTISTAAQVAGLAADSAGVYGTGWASGASTHFGMGGFFGGINDSSAAGAERRVNGLQVVAVNQTANDAVVVANNYNGGGISIFVGSSFNKVATAIEIHNSGSAGHGAKAGLFDIGIHSNSVVSNGLTGAIDKALIQDDASGLYSYLIQGTHATAAMAVAAGSGKIIIGGTSGLLSAALLEVQAPNASINPLVLFGSTAFTQAWRLLRLQNSSGAVDVCVAASVNQFVNGTVAGDVAFLSTTSAKFLHLAGGTNSVVKVGTDDSLVLKAALATAAGGAVIATLGNGTVDVVAGSGAPTVSARKGSLYLRTDGSTTNDRMYVNTNGSTTWAAVTTAA